MLALPMRRVLLSLSVLVLAVPGVASAALRAPTPVSPANGATTTYVPAIGWTAVAGADRYVYQLAADAGFNSPVAISGSTVVVSGASVLETFNTWATFKTAIPNGNYYWHVRAVDKAGKLSPWSAPRLFRKQWRGDTTVISPGDGATITFPTNPTLTWAPVAGAARYEFTLASDPALSSLDGKPAKGIETDASSFTVTSGLSAGSTYFWSVTPIDAAGNRGTAPAEPWRFTWKWNSKTDLTFEDLAPAADVVDPRFSWDPIPNAARYEVEINSDAGFAAGSKFCCTVPTVATTLTPTTVLLNNRYYWRVRGIDADGNFGVWNYWSNPVTHDAFFRKTFDTRDPGDTNPAIQNLRMVDHLTDLGGEGTDADLSTDGYQTQVPIVTWDPVLGASAYEVDVRYYTGGGCSTANAQKWWDVTVGTNAWTPLGPNPLDEPWPNHGRALSHDGAKHMDAGDAYCVRVRAYSDRGYDQNHILHDVVGDWAYLDTGLDPSGNNAVSFQFLGYPDDTSCTDVQPQYTCSAAYPQNGDYLLPQ
ncbi:MAG: large repetitive protein, partial [Gaiellaceae bacterium]|nr:large repetitive protein [Gaiellaceae bacterium]